MAVRDKEQKTHGRAFESPELFGGVCEHVKESRT